MAAINPYLRFFNLVTGAAYSHTNAGDIVFANIDRQLDVPAKITVSLGILCQCSVDIINATGGPSLFGAVTPLLGEFSWDGGASVVLRFVLVSAQRVMDPARPLLTISQDDCFALYGVTGVDRVTYVDAKPADVLNGKAGTIPRPKGSIGTVKMWPYVKGLFQTIPGLGTWLGQPKLAMTPVIDPILSKLPLSADINADTILHALTTIAKRLSGAYILGDTAPPGSRGHIVPVTGDAIHSPVGVGMAVMVGRVGTKPKVIFDGDGTGTWDETTTARIVGAGLNVDPLLAELYTQASFIGGISDHGISTGMGTSGSKSTSITALQVINTKNGDSSTRWDDCLCIVGSTAGVYYYPQAGFLVPMSQPFVVNAIGYYAATHTLFAAGNNGVFSASAKPPPYGSKNQPAWPRLGGISAPVEDLWMDGANVLIRCGGSTKKNGQGVDGVYIYPALSGDTSGTGKGYDGWSRVTSSGAPLAAGGSIAHVYYTDRGKPGIVRHIQPGTGIAPVQCTGLGAGQNVVAMSTGGGYVYVLTDAGVAGMYAVAIGTSALISANPDGSIQSNDGSPVQVRRIQALGAAIAGEYVALFAATDAGLYLSDSPTGGGWRAPNATSGLGDFDIAHVAAGVPQTVLGRVITRIFAAAERSFLISHNAGDNWQELLQERLDMGPFWAALAQQCGGVPWPDNTVTALGNATGGGFIPAGGTFNPGGTIDTGGTGTYLGIPASSKLGATHQLPSSWIWARRLDERNAFTYRLTNLASQAPMNGIQWHELPEIQAGADVGVIKASEQVALVVFRWLYAASQVRIQIPANSAATQSNAAILDLYPTDVATYRYNPAGFGSVLALNLALYVQSHIVTYSGGVTRTSSMLGTTLEKSQLDPNALAAAQADRLTRRMRFGSA